MRVRRIYEHTDLFSNIIIVKEPIDVTSVGYVGLSQNHKTGGGVYDRVLTQKIGSL